MFKSRHSVLIFLVVVLLCFLRGGGLVGQGALSPIDSFDRLWNPDPNRNAEAFPVRLRGQVLYYDPIWQLLWIHDGQVGGYIGTEGESLGLFPGDHVLVTGETVPGATSINMATAQVQVERPGILPQPERLSEDDLTDVAYNDRFIAIEGIVYQVEEVDQHLQLGLVVGVTKCEVVLNLERGVQYPLLNECLVRLEGVVALPNVASESPGVPTFFVNGLDDVKVLESGLDYLFRSAPISVSELDDSAIGRRVVIEGGVLEVEVGKRLVIQSSGGAVEADVWQENAVLVGDQLVVSGVLMKAEGQWRLADSVFLDTALAKASREGYETRSRVVPVDRLRQVLRSPAEGAAAVRVMGIVTAVARREEVSTVYLQDESGAVQLSGSQDLEIGTPPVWLDALVELSGGDPEAGNGLRISQVLRQAPGRYPIPRSVAVPPEMVRQVEGQFAELVGLVTDVEIGDDAGVRLAIQNTQGEYRVLVQGGELEKPQDLIESVVVVCGVCRVFEGANRGSSRLEVLVPDASLLKVRRGRESEPFAAALTEISAIRELPTPLGERRVVRGFVSHVRRPGELYVADRSGGLFVRLRDVQEVSVGERVEVSGIPVRDGRRLTLQRGVVRPAEDEASPVKPLPVSGFERVRPDLIGLPVRVAGRVVEFDASSRTPVMRLLNRSSILRVECPPGIDPVARDATVAVTAVYLANYDEFGVPIQPRLVVSDAAAIELLHSPPWLSARQLFAAAGVAGFLALLGWFWNVSLRRQVAQKTREIRQRHRKETVLQDRFRLLVDSASDLILSCGRDGRIHFFSQAGQEMMGYDESEAITMNLQDLVEPEYRRNVLLLRDDSGVLADGVSWEMRFRRKDGSSFWGEMSLRSLPDVTEALGVLGVVRDISGRIAVQDELKRAKEAAEEADRSKGQFLANMSHEIRTPMNGVIGMAELLLDSPLDEDQRGYADTIRSSGQTLIKVINDILDFSKVESGRMTIDPQPFSLRSMIEHLVDSVDQEAASKGLYLSSYLPIGAPDVVVGDEVRIRQVLWNLLGNAVKFTQEGGVRVGASIRSVDEGLWCDIEIRDTGIGIEAEKLEKIFEPFSQADASTTRRFGGTGLGLAISQNLAESMGGSIQLESQCGEGSSFVLSLPLGLGAGEPAAEAAFTPETDSAVLLGSCAALDPYLESYLRDLGLTVTHSRLDEGIESVLKHALNRTGVVICLLDSETLSLFRDRMLAVMDRLSDGDRLKVLRLDRRCAPVEVSEPLDGIGTLRFPTRLAELRDSLLRGTAPDRTIRRMNVPVTTSRQRSLSILVAEDSVINRRVIGAQLERLGHRPVLAENGQVLLSLLENTPYDLILMDCQMPVLDGFQATRAIRKIPRHEDAIIVALTAAAREEDRRECFAAGMNDFISKPVVIERLQEVLLKVASEADSKDQGGKDSSQDVEGNSRTA